MRRSAEPAPGPRPRTRLNCRKEAKSNVETTTLLHRKHKSIWEMGSLSPPVAGGRNYTNWKQRSGAPVLQTDEEEDDGRRGEKRQLVPKRCTNLEVFGGRGTQKLFFDSQLRS